MTGTLVGVTSLSAAAATCGDGVLVTETRSTNGTMHERCWIKCASEMESSLLKSTFGATLSLSSGGVTSLLVEERDDVDSVVAVSDWSSLVEVVAVVVADEVSVASAAAESSSACKADVSA